MARGPERRYRDRIQRLKRRAAFLRMLIEKDPQRPRGWAREVAEISALEWAVSILEPWFAKADAPPADAAVAKGDTVL